VNTTDKTATWKDVRCVCLPVNDLEVLADLRGRPEIRVTVAGERAWVCWPVDSDLMPEILARRILPLEGVEMFTERGGEWYRPGEHLPAFDVPFRAGAAGVALDRIVIPSKLSAQRPQGSLTDRLRVRLVHDERQEARPATALRCSLRVLCAWAERATTSQLSCLQGAWRRASDGEEADAEALILGFPGRLPLLQESVRYWGTDLLVPLGFRVDPDLPEPAIRRVVGAGTGDLVVGDEDGFELIARVAFKPLTRASVRLAQNGSAGSRWDQGNRP
jgi:hypothetical protein